MIYRVCGFNPDRHFSPYQLTLGEIQEVTGKLLEKFTPEGLRKAVTLEKFNPEESCCIC